MFLIQPVLQNLFKSLSNFYSHASDLNKLETVLESMGKSNISYGMGIRYG